MAVTYDIIKAVDNGAQFFNADLHVHSFGASHDVNDATMTVEGIVDAAVKMGIRLLAITDHNSDANTSKSISYAQKYTGHILVLAGVEITTSHGHLLGYFAPDQAGHVRNLLAKINLQGEPGEKNTHTAMSMADVIKEVEAQGGVSIAAHIDRVKTGFEMVVAGYPNWKRDVMLSSGLYALEFDDPINLNWYSPLDDTTPNGTERKKIVKAREQSAPLAGRSRLAHIQGSDAHTLKDFITGRSGKILTRFKLNELSYDAFRTALADSEARVRAVVSIPHSIPRILGMHVTGGFLDEQVYHFSDNLNCFIGGRGTGKSSALKNLAHGLGINDDLEPNDNCPTSVVVYCEDANGMRYRYEKPRGADVIVTAKVEGEIADVPVDSFRVEYYRQGELAEVAKDPLKNPSLLQAFLDRHLLLADLTAKEAQLVNALKQNSAQLIPLETSAAQLGPKKQVLADINKKQKLAEEGKLSEIAAEQGRVANEKTFATSLEAVRGDYLLGADMSAFVRDFDELKASVGTTSGSADADSALLKIKGIIDGVNEYVKQAERELKTKLATAAKEILTALSELKKLHGTLDSGLAAKIAALKNKGLEESITELQNLIKQKTALTLEINKLTTQNMQLVQVRKTRKERLVELEQTRFEIAERRKQQLDSINQNLASTIEDYRVFLRYDPNGITHEFKEFFLQEMHGSYFQDEAAVQFCSKITPVDLAELVLANDAEAIADSTGVHVDWATQICQKLRFYGILHTLEIMWKPPCPLITVLTKATPPNRIPVNQLSDGQKHTIMLTIAMLAESNIPLVIDQPEDDLDNAFIFNAVVRVLRTIKERRQVILVTHNANIAVLGDAELLLPMKRNGDCGEVFDFGSVDRTETKEAALNILEGGEIAFQRRREIYGY
jgi:ABC-type histidine transport system ATPase subunit